MTKKEKKFCPVITKNSDWKILTKNIVTFKRWEGVKDENFNFFRVDGKTRFLGGRGVHKNNI